MIHLVLYFYPRSPCGERPDSLTDDVSTGGFLSTLSLRRATISALWMVANLPLFLSTLSLRRATPRNWQKPHGQKTFLSTLSLRRATVRCCGQWGLLRISIHALLAESDDRQRKRHSHSLDFYPRSPCGERHRQQNRPLRHSGFLSTLSLRRATIFAVRPYDAPIFLSTLSLRRATYYMQWDITDTVISIHALLAESDPAICQCTAPATIFLSTLSLRRATRSSRVPAVCHLYFYPRSPCGERQTSLVVIGTNCVISIHALLAESDVRRLTMADFDKIFLSTLSLRRATANAR